MVAVDKEEGSLCDDDAQESDGQESTAPSHLSPSLKHPHIEIGRYYHSGGGGREGLAGRRWRGFTHLSDVISDVEFLDLHLGLRRHRLADDTCGSRGRARSGGAPSMMVAERILPILTENTARMDNDRKLSSSNLLGWEVKRGATCIFVREPMGRGSSRECSQWYAKVVRVLVDKYFCRDEKR